MLIYVIGTFILTVTLLHLSMECCVNLIYHEFENNTRLEWIIYLHERWRKALVNFLAVRTSL